MNTVDILITMWSNAYNSNEYCNIWYVQMSEMQKICQKEPSSIEIMTISHSFSALLSKNLRWGCFPFL